MMGNRRRDTLPEVRLRSALHRRGARFRVDFPIRPDDGRPIRVDVAFTRRRLAVFVDGCFWHGCPVHGRQPKANNKFWSAKIERNRARDTRDVDRLGGAGWTVLRLWEHVSAHEGADAVLAALGSIAQEVRSIR